MALTDGPVELEEAALSLLETARLEVAEAAVSRGLVAEVRECEVMLLLGEAVPLVVGAATLEDAAREDCVGVLVLLLAAEEGPGLLLDIRVEPTSFLNLLFIGLICAAWPTASDGGEIDDADSGERVQLAGEREW